MADHSAEIYELRTDFTARRMMGYSAQNKRLPLEEVADEMFAILSDRERIVQKHMSEHAQNKINEYYRTRTEDDSDDDR